MKKFALLIVFLMLASFAHAERGVMTNVYASWVNVTQGSQFAVQVPGNYKSRDVWIHNGSAVDVCVHLLGGDITFRQPNGTISDCRTLTDSYVFQLDGASEAYFQDFATSRVTVRSAAGAASPVSVVITY